MTTLKKHLVGTMAAAAALAFSATVAQAAPFTHEVYHDDFAYAEGASPTGWTVKQGIWTIDARERYVHKPTAADTTGITVYEGQLADGSDAYALTDYRIVTAVDRDGFNPSGPIGRFQDAANFYTGRRSGSELQIYKWVDGTPELLASSGGVTAIGGIIELIFEGSTITLNFYDHNDPTALLGTVQATDDSFASGTFGGRGFGGAGVDFAMRDYTVFTAIPEPASLALVGLGGLLMIRRKR